MSRNWRIVRALAAIASLSLVASSSTQAAELPTTCTLVLSHQMPPVVRADCCYSGGVCWRNCMSTDWTQHPTQYLTSSEASIVCIDPPQAP